MSAQKILECVVSEQAVELKETFTYLVNQKIIEKLAERKIEIAKNLINPISESDEEEEENYEELDENDWNASVLNYKPKKKSSFNPKKYNKKRSGPSLGSYDELKALEKKAGK